MLSPDGLCSLIQYILATVHRQGGAISKRKLTNLLYLIDVEHYRQYQETLTGCKWYFEKNEEEKDGTV